MLRYFFRPPRFVRGQAEGVRLSKSSWDHLQDTAMFFVQGRLYKKKLEVFYA